MWQTRSFSLDTFRIGNIRAAGIAAEAPTDHGCGFL